jgi:hypothetical protein
MKSVVLTGGQSSQGIYKALAQMFEFKALTDIQFFYLMSAAFQIM